MTTPAPAAAVAGTVRLADWGVIRATGADARRFLHGQLTQDVAGLEPGQARLAGFCTPKGRLLATFVLWSPGPDEVLLACSADLLPAALKRLSMFVLRARCKLVDASGELALWGLAGDRVSEWAGASAAGPGRAMPHAGGTLLGLAPATIDGATVPRWLWVAPAGADAPPLPALPPTVWSACEAASGVLRVVAATGERFVPQMANFELVGGVDFHKGCYPGQEVVARSQYRGTLKRRGYLLTGAVLPAPGQEIVHSEDAGQPAGLVALAGTLPDGRHLAFAELKIAATESGTLHLDSADGPPLQLQPLPYTLPVETA